MSEAARKQYFFIPPSRDAVWSEDPPARAGFYWVLPARSGERPAPEIVRFDPEEACATPPAWALLEETGEVPPIPLERIRAWWPVPLTPPPVS